jgi:prevent-host-death family protein
MKIAPIAEIKAQLSAFIKASEEGPVIITKNGRPVAVLLGISDEDEIERLALAYSKKLQSLLDNAEKRIRATGGIPHDEFWQQVDAEYADAERNGDSSSETNSKPARKRRRKTAAEHPLEPTGG